MTPITEALKEIARLERENKIMREALEWIKENDKTEQTLPTNSGTSLFYQPYNDTIYYGVGSAKARAALAAIKEKKDE